MKKIIIAAAFLLSTGALTASATTFAEKNTSEKTGSKKDLGTADSKKDLGTADSKKDLGTADSKKDLGTAD